MTDMPERIWVSGNGSWHAVGDGVWASDTEYVRADLSSLAALAMREAAAKCVEDVGEDEPDIFPFANQIADMIRPIPPTFTSAAILAAALRVPKIAALVEAANQSRLAMAGYVSRQSALDKLDAALSALEPKP